MKVKELMTTDPIVAEVPGTRDAVLRLLVQHAVTGLPVVKSGTQELAGIVTRSDVFRRPDEEQLALVMTSDPLTVAPDADVNEAARILHDNRIHTLPVVEDGTRLVGIITATDILRITTEQNGRAVREFTQGSVVPVYEETPLSAVWMTMRLARQNALPVIDGEGALSGIVADSDLFKTSDVEERIGRRELGLAQEEDDWMWDNIRDIAPFYYAKSVVDLPKKAVKEIMVKDVVTVFERTGVSEAARKMIKLRVNQLPVVDANDRLVGLITDLDLLRTQFQA